MVTRTFNTSKGIVTTTLTDAEAIAACRQIRSDFAISLVQQHDQHLQNHRRRPLTHSQWGWCHKMAMEIAHAHAGKEVVDIGNLSGIGKLFQIARRKLQYPKIRLQAQGQNGLTPVLLSIRRDGGINVASGPYGRGVYFGRIKPSGQFEHNTNCPPEVIELLVAFAKEPAKVASEYGKLTGSCSFCGAELTDPRSVAVGRGPICSANFGLPYPTMAEAQSNHHISTNLFEQERQVDDVLERTAVVRTPPQTEAMLTPDQERQLDIYFADLEQAQEREESRQVAEYKMRRDGYGY